MICVIFAFFIWLLDGNDAPGNAEVCTSFAVGPEECFRIIQSDIIFVLDSSSSISNENWAIFIRTLSEAIQMIPLDAPLAESIGQIPIDAGANQVGARVGLMQFASSDNVDVIFQLDNDLTRQEINETIYNLQLSGGSSALRTALNTARLRMWPISDDPTRNKVMFIFSDAAYTRGENPCSLGDNFAAMEIDIVIAGVIEDLDDTFQFPACFQQYPDQNEVRSVKIDQWGENSADVVEDFLSVCQPAEQTPYDDFVYWEWLEDTTSDFPIYTSMARYEIRANPEEGFWYFTDPSGNLVDMTSETTDPFIPHPANYSTWIYNDIVYTDVLITCGGCELYPDICTSESPTTTPSQIPSKTPSRTPSASPVTSPTISPSVTEPCPILRVFGGACNDPSGVEVVFVFDVDTSASPSDYDLMKEYLKKMLTDYIPFIFTTRFGFQGFGGPSLIGFPFGFDPVLWLSTIDAVPQLPALSFSSTLENGVNAGLDMFTSDEEDSRIMLVIYDQASSSSLCDVEFPPDLTLVVIAISADNNAVLGDVFCLNSKPFDRPPTILIAESYSTLNDLNGDTGHAMCGEPHPLHGDYDYNSIADRRMRFLSSEGTNDLIIYVSNSWNIGQFGNFGLTTEEDNETGRVQVPPYRAFWNDAATSSPLQVFTECHQISDPTLAPSTDQPSQFPTSEEPSISPTTDQPSRFPSPLPTKQPTLFPSFNPSDSPSFHPTTHPSNSPSTHPTFTPSTHPTVNPSNTPSLAPTLFPSSVPTRNPSNIPSHFPTSMPTYVPSCSPTTHPNQIPLFIPTEEPSKSLSTFPSSPPSGLPTCLPSGIPTTHPSLPPAFLPSYAPTKDPTCRPSTHPSTNPSLNPSRTPTAPPSIYPSICPTFNPTGYPSFVPTLAPSHVPTKCPSNNPSLVPTNIPSRHPTLSPTHNPSLIPTQIPTSRPTTYPTKSPTICPSLNPSLLPSRGPSKLPSNFPTRKPSREPTSIPSLNPSHLPTLVPSYSPSDVPTSFPSTCPSFTPTELPTATPSTHPSHLPTFYPSNTPSSLPTRLPTCFPSFIPTWFPSREPSHYPSLSPTFNPSYYPSAHPTNFPSSRPTKNPSKFPSDWPSTLPTHFPSRKPTGYPSTLPTTYPTQNPTSNPTRNPTHNPSSIPSFHPSQIPSMSPSFRPSRQPTINPTRMPTALPTFIPSLNPSQAPSNQPTATPTCFPTVVPSHDPTHSPSFLPSHTPSLAPSRDPSINPSRSPSNLPSLSPSFTPIFDPTSNPTHPPTFQPTHVPSNAPSAFPTMFPSNTPSILPSMLPTSIPSSNPTQMPSVYPSQAPSNIPSSFPSQQPSMIPTYQPTMLPSPAPSFQPSHIPTFAPSDIPSNRPTLNPTHTPSKTPSTLPSDRPSANPTDYPTKTPSFIPSHVPTCEPSGFPSCHPTYSPSNTPTAMPTIFPSNIPTSLPSDSPTMIPSYLPSTSPTKFPTNNPTQKPTSCPSASPTYKPSHHPSSSPTHNPSETPSSIPSLLPTINPSHLPTLHPTKMPSNFPSETPTYQPSYIPSVKPSSLPTHTPSNLPTILPSAFPSRHPTSSPTHIPSETPSSRPSVLPTINPSHLPTLHPTKMPSNFPSEPPTCQPSYIPSVKPSSLPTHTPSNLPTILPSVFPSKHPTSFPSSLPTMIPTNIPSHAPSVQPTCKPSRIPSNFPSTSPSSNPTNHPSINPTAPTLVSSRSPTRVGETYNPTDQPSQCPSYGPTFMPTRNPTREGETLIPTIFPTVIPSQFPTPSRTVVPSTVSSPCPSQHPTQITGTQSPTHQPSRNPFHVSTFQPTTEVVTQNPTAHDIPANDGVNSSFKPTRFQKPSHFPTPITTTSSSGSPIDAPSGNPTLHPSFSPSIFPTNDPSSHPSISPTNSPSCNPTVFPSQFPSNAPTFCPTFNPTREPTDIPSKTPTTNPSLDPTKLPTSVPTFNPSRTPTNFPSRNPTMNPTLNPTKFPTLVPTFNPSRTPTNFPSRSPTMNPSFSPTAFPTLIPTFKPSREPTNLPTRSPTINPTFRPTAFPSLEPSFNPTFEPTNLPTKNPTMSPTLNPTTLVCQKIRVFSGPCDDPSGVELVFAFDRDNTAASDDYTLLKTFLINILQTNILFETTSFGFQAFGGATVESLHFDTPSNLWTSSLENVNQADEKVSTATEAVAAGLAMFTDSDTSKIFIILVDELSASSLCNLTFPRELVVIVIYIGVTGDPQNVTCIFDAELFIDPLFLFIPSYSLLSDSEPEVRIAMCGDVTSKNGNYRQSGLNEERLVFSRISGSGDEIIYSNSQWNIGTPPSYDFTTSTLNEDPASIPPESAIWFDGSAFISLYTECLKCLAVLVYTESRCDLSNGGFTDASFDLDECVSQALQLDAVYFSWSPTQGCEIPLSDDFLSCNDNRRSVSSRSGNSDWSIYSVNCDVPDPSFAPTIHPTNTPSVCPTSCPTIFPSINPSMEPTSFPSRLPSFSPTLHPTINPTMNPTHTPSSVPSNSPSTSPSETPSSCPSFSPTLIPTKIPSREPSNAPSNRPTLEPTCEPSKIPSCLPSLIPTQYPSCKPSRSPTQTPSTHPTHVPTRSPTHFPTENPTMNPSPRPSKYPTTKPSHEPTTSSPTFEPSLSPTRNPTYHPSPGPTKHPTVFPTKPPSHRPSRSPSRAPSFTPSTFPSSSPSVNPSYPPTFRPTMTPTSAPSAPPTNTPSLQPSMIPTTAPSREPTIHPTKEPSANPTSLPSKNPTCHPTDFPSEDPTINRATFSPSLDPTYSPTAFPSPDPATSAPSPHPFTSAPSWAPTADPVPLVIDPTPAADENCDSFIFGSVPCEDEYDITFILDSSITVSSVQWNTLKNVLVDSLETKWIDTPYARISAFTYGDEVVQIFSPDDTNSEQSSQLRNTAAAGGIANSQDAMSEALQQNEGILSTGRVIQPAYFILITAGSGAANQYPCDGNGVFIEEFQRTGVHTVAIIIGESNPMDRRRAYDITGFSCMDQVMTYNSYDDLPNLFFLRECYTDTSSSPYDNIYTWDGTFSEDRKVFTSNEYTAEFVSGRWEFTHPFISLQYQRFGLQEYRPPHLGAWRWERYGFYNYPASCLLSSPVSITTPSSSPTQFPSSQPTQSPFPLVPNPVSSNNENCDEFYVGQSQCDDEFRIYFLLDSSDTIDTREWETTKDSLIFAIEDKYESTPWVNIGVSSFGAYRHSIFSPTDTLTNQEILNQMDSIPRIDGQAHTRSAVESIYSELGSPAYVDVPSYIVIVTDGHVANEDEYPCCPDNQIMQLQNAGISVIALLIGVPTYNIGGYSCLDQIFIYPSYYQSFSEDLFLLQECYEPNHDASTSYDGIYSFQGYPLVDGKKVFTSGSNIATYDGKTWVFSSTFLPLPQLTELVHSDGNRPPNGVEWVIRSSTIYAYPIVCVLDSPITDAYPSQSPSLEPTSPPSAEQKWLLSEPVPVDDENCDQFYVGICPCTDTFDLYYMLDSSGTIDDDEWTAMVTQVADTIETRWSDTPYANIAVYSYGTNVRVLFDMSHPGTYEEKADIVRNSPHQGGGTWSRRALEYLYRLMGEPRSVQRNTYIVFISDGIVTHSGQFPCDHYGELGLIDDIQSAGIQTVAYLIGSNITDTNYNCLTNYTVLYPDWNDLPPFYFHPSCYGEEQEGPYNGLYSWNGDVSVNQKVFVSGENIAFFDGDVWMFESDVQEDKFELEVQYALTSNRPPYGANWTFDGIEYVNFPICCVMTSSVTETIPTTPTSSFEIIQGTVPESIATCTTFVVGSCACDPSTVEADFVFALDSSQRISDYVWQTLTASLAEAFRILYQNGEPRYSLVHFATSVTIEVAHGTTLEMARALSTLRRYGSSSWLRRALEYSNRILNSDRMGFIVLLSDGNAALNMEICDGTERSYIVDLLYSRGVKIQPVVIDPTSANLDAFSCLEADPIILNTISPLDVYFATDCLQTAYNPYEGTYRYVDVVNGKNRYMRQIGDTLDYTVFWTETNWLFLGAENQMSELTPLGGSRPLNGSDYFYGVEEVYNDVLICCSPDAVIGIETGSPTSAIPSQTPSVQPTDIPTKCPSVKPTKQPSMENCDHITDTEEVINCLKIELEEVNDIITDLKSDIEDLSEDVNGRCEAAYNRLENSLDTCGTPGR